jgi:hypothetical protein
VKGIKSDLDKSAHYFISTSGWLKAIDDAGGLQTHPQQLDSTHFIWIAPSPERQRKN